VTSPTPDDIALLNAVRVYPGTSVAKLAKVLRSTPKAVEKRVTDLEASGLLELRGHPDRSNVREIHVTPLGKSIIDPA
jgi:DNA-binding MarR family transcriptional regulator